MNLVELIDEIKKVVLEIDQEEVDYKKIKNLMSVLKKLLIKFKERAFLSTLEELEKASDFLLATYWSNADGNFADIVQYLYQYIVEVQKNEYIDFSVSPKIK